MTARARCRRKFAHLALRTDAQAALANGAKVVTDCGRVIKPLPEAEARKLAVCPLCRVTNNAAALVWTQLADFDPYWKDPS